MSRRPARCTEADLKRAVKAALVGKNSRVVIEIPETGPIRVISEPAPIANVPAPKRRIAL